MWTCSHVLKKEKWKLTQEKTKPGEVIKGGEIVKYLTE